MVVDVVQGSLDGAGVGEAGVGIVVRLDKVVVVSEADAIVDGVTDAAQLVTPEAVG